MAMKCDVRDCGEKAIPCYGVQLCVHHGTQANVALARQGLEYGTWPDRVAAVAKWLTARQHNQAGRGA